MGRNKMAHPINSGKCFDRMQNHLEVTSCPNCSMNKTIFTLFKAKLIFLYMLCPFKKALNLYALSCKLGVNKPITKK